MNRPDFSNYVAHFTSDREPTASTNPKNKILKEIIVEGGFSTAKDRLIKILRDKKIVASNIIRTKMDAVCFTECPWASLVSHTQRYSSYGIGFSKEFLFATGGAPAMYVRPDYFKNIDDWGANMVFVTPFWPSYATVKQKGKTKFQPCDYTHEREWRVPHNLEFDYDDISFIVLKDYNDMAKFPQEYKDAIGREKFILMDNYKKIEELWPVHKL